MPKRKCEFDELPLLSKMHIGIKEINTGVNFKENMKKVYERTNALLFNGLVKNQASFPNSNVIENLNPRAISQKNKAETMRSCCLSSQNKSSCSFCENTVCGSCFRMCHLCNMEYCHLCSILQYASQEETAVCLSCV